MLQRPRPWVGPVEEVRAVELPGIYGVVMLGEQPGSF
jgi:hypothetical protein